MKHGRSLAALWLGLGLAPAPVLAAGDAGALPPLPARLADTGLYVAGSATEVAPGTLAFSPQYPLWSDGATKRRWIALPPGTSIDASNPDAWDFPVGTRLWKEFALGRRIETRYIERVADGSWRFATYVWNEQGTEATLAPASGIAALPLEGATRRGRYEIPGEYDCRACHEGAPSPVLGFGALQLSPDRDPLAPHAEAGPVDLHTLLARGWVRNLPPELLETPPRIAARSATERAALGYLHGNCGHCHAAPGTTQGSVPVGLVLAQTVGRRTQGVATVLASLVDAASRFRPHGAAGAPARVIVPGRSSQSVLSQRMRSRDPRVQMPPLGTTVVDAEALTLVERWIDSDLEFRKTANDPNPTQETSRWNPGLSARSR